MIGLRVFSASNMLDIAVVVRNVGVGHLAWHGIYLELLGFEKNKIL